MNTYEILETIIAERERLDRAISALHLVVDWGISPHVLSLEGEIL